MKTIKIKIGDEIRKFKKCEPYFPKTSFEYSEEDLKTIGVEIYKCGGTYIYKHLGKKTWVVPEVSILSTYLEIDLKEGGVL